MKTESGDWNVVATVFDGEFAEAVRLLAPFGKIARTDFWNVLVMTVADIPEFMRRLAETVAQDASIPNSVSRIVPVTHRFRFQSPEEFEEQARAVVDEWVPRLHGRKFHVRMHRRGFKGRISSQHEEQFLDHHLLERLAEAGAPGEIDFDDPDFIIAVETVGQAAGLSIWTREEVRSFGLLKLD